MEYEVSCGALVFTRINDEIYWVIIRSLEGIYGFAKGHIEKGETEKETAMREVWEETHLLPVFIDGFIAEDEYPLPKKPGVMKKVIYFLAEYEGQEIVFQKEELLGAYLMTYDEAKECLQFQPSRDILKKANDFVKNMK